MLKTLSVKIDTLHADPANLRLHPVRNLDTIKASLARFGQQKPIVVDAKGIVRAGNGTLEAARLLGWKQINIVRTNLAGSEAIAYGIADNRTAELAEWDEDRLGEVLKALEAEDFDLDDIGFNADELDELLGAQGSTAEDPGAQLDKAAELQAKWRTKRGQLWEIGKHRLLCGDSTKAKDVARVMGGEKARAIVTDPPYGIYDCGGKWGHKKDLEWDRQAAIGVDELVRGVQYVVVWGGNYFPLPPSRGWLVWFKRDAVPSASQIELAWTSLDMNSKLIDHPIAATNAERIGHPTQKPLAVMRWSIEQLNLDPNCLIFDPFAGSGTTLVAAEQTGRVCRGIEIEPKYVAVILERMGGMGLNPSLAKTKDDPKGAKCNSR